MTNSEGSIISDLIDFIMCCISIEASKKKAKEILERNPKLAERVREIVKEKPN